MIVSHKVDDSLAALACVVRWLGQIDRSVMNRGSISKRVNVPSMTCNKYPSG
jgi:hypothetical protein